MTPVRPRFSASRAPAGHRGAAGVLWLVVLGLPLGLLIGSAVPAAGAGSAADGRFSSFGAVPAGTVAVTVREVGPAPTEVGVGAPTVLSWEALDAQGVRASAFAAAAELTVTESANGSSAPAWVNASAAGPLARAANGTYAVPAAAWSGGVLNLSVDLAVAVPVTVRLFGPLLPSLPAPVLLTVLPDLDHLALYAAEEVQDNLSNASRSYSAFWHVCDRFGDPAPGASLIVEYSAGGSMNQTVVPVVGLAGGASGAWVNYTAPGRGNGSFAVLDEAGATLLGPLSVPAVATESGSGGGSLPPLALAAVGLLVAGGVGGVGALLAGGRPRRSTTPTGEEEELRRLAEGRATVVELVRRKGPLTLREIESAWESPPAPRALADWVASLVTDGTLTATLAEGGKARFSVPERPAGSPRVTLDEDALAQGIARRDAALEDEETDGGPP